jgi:hypothetical protein
MRPLMLVQVVACFLAITGFLWMPQSLHPAVLPLAVMLIITYVRIYRNSRNIDN